jgi:hypothetical protein
MKIKNYLLPLLLTLSTNLYTPVTYARQPEISVAYKTEQSPTYRYLSEHQYEDIKKEFNKFNFSKNDEKLFNKMIDQENSSFIGYHASSTDFLIFQDIIRLTIEEIMKISIPKNFHFFRNPLDRKLIYETADDFTEAMPIPKSGKDSSPTIRRHILSLNVALYQSFDSHGNSTPRYYLDNETWTTPAYEDTLKSFFEEVGLDPGTVTSIYAKAKKNLPTERGIIYQFFIKDEEYTSINSFFYVAKSGGAQIPFSSPTDVLFDYNRCDFPQLRMVLNAKTTLNPYGKIEVRQYDSLSKSQKQKYQNLLRAEIRKLAVESKKLLKAKNKLLRNWS